ncbi:MAG: hypothetical protein UH239_00760 [Acutalibacteraceae bacterium]|nr:hypothetical protein [Acutalibacteraceae bacterium]
MKFLEWNIHGMGGYGNYSIPCFVADQIILKNVDIAVLVEFFTGCNWNYIRGILEKKYILIVSPYIEGYNQVLIALKKEIFEIKNVITLNPIDKNKPEFLQVSTDVNGKSLEVIGTRLKTVSGTKNEQLRFLKNYFDKLNNFICLGDFNGNVNFLQKELGKNCIYSPRVVPKGNNEILRWSYIHKNKTRINVDHIISNVNILRNISDSLSEKEGYKMYAKYDWGFVNKNNGYGKLNSESHLSHLIGLPDHAILLGEFEI